MTRGPTLAILLAAASAAAFSLRPRGAADAGHDPRHAQALERARETLPVLGALRIRSELPDAPARLKSMRGGTLRVVASLDDAQAVLRRSALLFATAEELSAIEEAMEGGRPLPPLPRAPDASRHFRDRDGVYRCDVVPLAPNATERIREAIPDSRISGAGEGEGRREGGLLRALLAALLLAAISRAPEKRLVAPLSGLALLGLLGLGFDGPSVLAAAVAAAAPPGLALLPGAAGILFPSLALRRMGFIFLAAAALRFRREARPPTRWRLLVPALLVLLLPREAPVSGAREPAAAFVPAERLAERARELRELGGGEVAGDGEAQPPPADPRKSATIRRIFRLAESRLSRGPDPLLEGLREAASHDSWPSSGDLDARLVARDGRRVLWMPASRDPLALAGLGDVHGAELTLLEGERQLRRESAVLSLLLFVLGALLAPRRLPAALAGFLAGALLLSLAGGDASPLPAAAALAAAPAALPALGAGAIFLEGPARLQALAALLAAAVTWGLERWSLPRRPPLPSAPPPPP